METELHEDQQYHGEFRCINLGPHKIRERLEKETDPAEREALEIALMYWTIKQPSGCVAGEPYRGEKKDAIHAKSMTELAKAVKPVKHVFVRGKLDTK